MMLSTKSHVTTEPNLINPLLGEKKSTVLEKNTSSTSNEKSNEYSVFILIGHYILQAAKLIKRKPSRP